MHALLPWQGWHNTFNVVADDDVWTSEGVTRCPKSASISNSLVMTTHVLLFFFLILFLGLLKDVIAPHSIDNYKKKKHMEKN